MSDLLNKLLNELAEEIDITDSQEGAVKRAYNSVADWLNQAGTTIAKHNVHIFPQGSMMYGTAIKPIEEDDYDVDLVCEFTEFVNGLLPQYVKLSVGQRLKESSVYNKMLDEEGRRCWTLQYSENLNFHMDILPAIPFKEEYRMDSRLNDAYTSISRGQDLALLATDKDKITQKYRFIPTNPRGYADWFRDKMQCGTKRALFDSVERMPSYPRKTILQKSIQLLKRYRDVYFVKKDEDLKPISMIITTLVAKCYNGEDKIYDFICKAINTMPNLIERDSSGKYIIKNPVMSAENFADKWNEIPAKATAFFEWIKQAKIDFERLKNIDTYTEFSKVLKELFAQKPVDRLMEKYKINIQQESGMLSEKKPDSLIALEKLAHRVRPPWVLPKGYSVRIQARISYDNGRTYSSFASGVQIPKKVNLEFFPVHGIQTPYRVKWQITNTGEEAQNAHCLRGDIFENGEIERFGMPYGKKEVASYTGTHYVQCFIIKNGNQCVGVSEPFVVKIK